MVLADKRFTRFAVVMIVLYIITVAFFYKFPFDNNSIYRDMLGNSAAPAADMLHHKGIMHGRDEGGFYPKATMTRAELLTIMLRADGTDTDPLNKVPAETKYKDVPKEHWAASIVKAADEKGLIFFADAKNGSLNPDKPITRAELAAAITRTLKLQPGSHQIQLSDIGGNPYEEDIKIILSNGFAEGKNQGTQFKFEPNSNALREEVAAMWFNALTETRWKNEVKGGKR